MRRQTPYSPWKGKVLFPFPGSHCPCTWSCPALRSFWSLADPSEWARCSAQCSADHRLLSANLLVCPLLECQVAEQSHCRQSQTNAAEECGRGTPEWTAYPCFSGRKLLGISRTAWPVSEVTMVGTGRCWCSYKWNTLISYTRHFYIVLKSALVWTVSMLSLIW